MRADELVAVVTKPPHFKGRTIVLTKLVNKNSNDALYLPSIISSVYVYVLDENHASSSLSFKLGQTFFIAYKQHATPLKLRNTSMVRIGLQKFRRHFVTINYFINYGTRSVRDSLHNGNYTIPYTMPYIWYHIHHNTIPF